MTAPIVQTHSGIWVVRDDLHPGGTKPPVRVTGTTISVKSVVRRFGRGFRWVRSA